MSPGQGGDDVLPRAFLQLVHLMASGAPPCWWGARGAPGRPAPLEFCGCSRYSWQLDLEMNVELEKE